VAEVLRAETTGGLLLIIAAASALIWANSPVADSYAALRDFRVGPASLHLDLTLGTWAADGLLAVFFFVVGLELKREFVAGDLRDPQRAALPIVAAVGGMAVPALVFLLWNLGASPGPEGWAIPTATDIAFALAVLAVISTHLPTALRTFLLTLAVVDDLLAVTVIAVFYTDELRPMFLVLAMLPLAAFALAVQRNVRATWLLVALAGLTWFLVHESGVHATVAGVLLGFTVPVLHRARTAAATEELPGLAEQFEHRLRPLSAGFAVPVFAFFAAGVTIGGFTGLIESLRHPVALGIISGLVIGKAVGIGGSAYLLARFTGADLDEQLSWTDVVGLAMLGGIGFTVSLLIGDLAFATDGALDEHVKVGVLTGSLTAALLATLVLRLRNRTYRQLHELESSDIDHDGIPDVYQADQHTSARRDET